MRKRRKHYTAQEKVAILRRHLIDNEPVSQLCDQRALQPTVFYRWQKEFFENGAAAFQTNNRGRRPPERERIARLEKKIKSRTKFSPRRTGKSAGPTRRVGSGKCGQTSDTWRKLSACRVETHLDACLEQSEAVPRKQPAPSVAPRYPVRTMARIFLGPLWRHP